MSLEEQIAKLTFAVEALTDAIHKQTAAVGAAPAAATAPAASVDTPARGRGRPPKNSLPPSPAQAAAMPASDPADDLSTDEPADEATWDEVVQAVQAYCSKHGQNKGRALLGGMKPPLAAVKGLAPERFREVRDAFRGAL